MEQLKAGARLRSTVCTTEVMAVGVPGGGAELTCGGAPMIPFTEEAPTGGPSDADATAVTLLGMDYVNEAGDLEILCTKPGDGSLATGGTLLVIKEAKPLPSSD